jgi:hypothetical protein
MIALVGSWMFERGQISSLELEPVATLEETGFARPSPGAASEAPIG